MPLYDELMSPGNILPLHANENHSSMKPYFNSAFMGGKGQMDFRFFILSHQRQIKYFILLY